ncbi:DUF402 domain-containing protein [Schaalia naturae]|uniref:DUF402 domain-containing protein n=1 Tax=Schaalia naturae TaxID=635203 RepID=A0ABW2SMQ7_9ACTO
MAGRTMLLRYLYPDGRLQAALPMRVVEDSGGTVVAWLAAGTQIEYWATAGGLADPRTVPLPQRFRQALGHAPRRWEGSGVLRVISLGEHWQVLRFWDPQSSRFSGWYVNLESAKLRHGNVIDAVDWHLDLLISPSFDVTWKDEDEALAACGTEYLRSRDLESARQVGERIAQDPRGFLASIGDWRAFVPDSGWGPLRLPDGWDRNPTG